MVLAHRRQLKLSPTPRRRGILLFPEDSATPTPATTPILSPSSETAPVLSPIPTRESEIILSPTAAQSNDLRRKRRREVEEPEFEEGSDDSDFYGFLADSFICSNENLMDISEPVNSDPLPVVSVRRSKRIARKRRKTDFVYY